MTGTEEPDPQQLARQLQRHVESLKAAGVEWLTAPLTAGQSSLAVSAQKTVCHPNSAPGSVDQAPGIAAVAALGDTLLPFVDSTSELTPDQRRHELQILSTTVSSCPRCSELVATRTQTVFGVGKIDPELCFVGEAPGADEDAKGEPFVGAAGQLLNRIIMACGLKREEVYICNIIKCRPPGNRLPLPHEVANCREYLEKQLALVQPKFICALGACAAQNLLGSKLSVGRLRGQFQAYKGIPVLCTYHPAYLLRSPDKKQEVWDDMKKLLARMGRPIPAR